MIKKIDIYYIILSLITTIIIYMLFSLIYFSEIKIYIPFLVTGLLSLLVFKISYFITNAVINKNSFFLYFTEE